MQIKINKFMIFIIMISIILIVFKFIFNSYFIGIFSKGLANQQNPLPNVSILQKEGNGIIQQIEEYKQKNGRYPSFSEELNFQGTTLQYGGFRYVLENDGSYRLSIGSSVHYDFYLYYQSNIKHWSIDKL